MTTRQYSLLSEISETLLSCRYVVLGAQTSHCKQVVFTGLDTNTVSSGWVHPAFSYSADFTTSIYSL